MYIHVHVCMYTCMHTYVHMHVHIYTYVHIQLLIIMYVTCMPVWMPCSRSDFTLAFVVSLYLLNVYMYTCFLSSSTRNLSVASCLSFHLYCVLPAASSRLVFSPTCEKHTLTIINFFFDDGVYTCTVLDDTGAEVTPGIITVILLPSEII